VAGCESQPAGESGGTGQSTAVATRPAGPETCKRDNTATGDLLRIAVIPKGTTHEFWKAIHAGAVKAQNETQGVQVIWKGPVKEDDRKAQIDVVYNFINQRVDGIALAPLDNQALVRPVREA